MMSLNGTESREPDGVQETSSASAGEPAASGPEATHQAMRSAEPYRLDQERLDDRDAHFSRPRKAQGPAMDEESTSAREQVHDADETPDETEPPPPAADD